MSALGAHDVKIDRKLSRARFSTESRDESPAKSAFLSSEASKWGSERSLGRLWALLGRSWGALGRSWGALGRSWGALGSLLGRSCGALGRSWALLGAPRSILARFWSSRGSILVPPGMDFRPSEATRATNFHMLLRSTHWD